MAGIRRKLALSLESSLKVCQHLIKRGGQRTKLIATREAQSASQIGRRNLVGHLGKFHIKAFLVAGATKRLHLERLPGDAPDLNPDEGMWNYLKRVELANVCCRDLAELRTHVIGARERLRHKRGVLRACSRQCGYDAKGTAEALRQPAGRWEQGVPAAP